MIKKVGGIWFWSIGPIGGSIHVKKNYEAPRLNVDGFGLSMCAVLFVAAFVQHTI